MLNENIKKVVKEKYNHCKEKHLDKFNIGTTKLVFIGVALLFVFYYGVIGLLFGSNIRKDVNAEIKEVAGLNSIGVASYIIDQEVQKNLWTPSLPVFFPTYFLDNLPNFQLGAMEANAKIVNAISTLAKTDERLDKSAKLLSYDGKIWMFDKSGVLPVASAASQYKKAKQQLKRANPLANGLSLDKTSLLFLTSKIYKDINKSLFAINKIIVEDDEADDSFYYNQGKVYAYVMFLKAMSVDYKNVLVEKDLYADFTNIIKSLEDASGITPFVVKNADKSSSVANHLYNMGYYMQRALIKLGKVNEALAQ